ncbi:MAG TPA: TlpA disulfide reductase family protein [Acidimicrobiales bacterium]|nr:TlpA disulfide reductase family protein [Acidimicrobiales bacterium]
MIAVGVLILATVGLLATVSRGGGPGNTTTAAFDLPALTGDGRIRLTDFKGQPTVVNFFASWCSACDLELPGYAKVSAELRGRVHFVGVDTLETGDPLYMPKRHNITWWPLAHDVGGSNGSGLHDSLGGGNNMPITAFYDAEGNLVDVDQGALPESSLRVRLRELYGM